MSRSPTLVNLLSNTNDCPGRTQAIACLETLEQKLAGKVRPQEVLNYIVQLDIYEQDKCDCDCDGDLAAWIHEYHKIYNGCIHELLVAYGYVDKVRRACRRDLRAPDPWPDQFPGLGRIVMKSYGAMLLTHFLTNRPSEQWIG